MSHILATSANETISEEFEDYYPVFHNASSWSAMSVEMLRNTLRHTDQKRWFVVYKYFVLRSAVGDVSLVGNIARIVSIRAKFHAFGPPRPIVIGGNQCRCPSVSAPRLSTTSSTAASAATSLVVSLGNVSCFTCQRLGIGVTLFRKQMLVLDKILGLYDSMQYHFCPQALFQSTHNERFSERL